MFFFNPGESESQFEHSDQNENQTDIRNIRWTNPELELSLFQIKVPTKKLENTKNKSKIKNTKKPGLKNIRNSENSYKLTSIFPIRVNVRINLNTQAYSKF